MVKSVGQYILVFYGFIAIVMANIGNYFDKVNGFSYGFLGGNILSIVLWITYGKKMAAA